MDAGETVWVVGGGITAAQFATSIADHADITLCTRHPSGPPCGRPILADETLAWQTRRGEHSNVLVTGKLAAGSVGALAGNIPGARRAAERIVDQHPTQQFAKQIG